MFTTTLQLGNPKQTLPVLLDLNWSDLFVPSSNCSTYNCLSRPRYNASLSATHLTNGTRIYVGYWTMGTRGIRSQDTLHLGSLSIDDYIFEEALAVGGEVWPNWMGPLSILGLSRLPYETPWSNLSSLSPFQCLVADEKLGRHLFALRLPQSEHETGELRFGAVNPDYAHGPTAVLDISDVTSDHNIADEAINGRWQIYAQHAQYGDDIFSDLSGRRAVFSTLFKELGLTHGLAERISTTIGHNFLDVPCTIRHRLPDFVIGLGSGNQTSEFVLSPEDYIREDPDSVYGCRAIFVDLEEEREDDLILLGSYFIDRFYHVFDAGSKTITCELVQITPLVQAKLMHT